MAFAILGLAILPVIDLFSATGRHAQAITEHSQALAVAEKAAEELRLAGWENPHLARVIEADARHRVEQPIVDGQSPFFEVVEDDAPPLGLIRRGQDTGITSSLAALHRLLRDHRLGLRSRMEMLATTGRVLMASLSVRWTRGERSIDAPPLEVAAAAPAAFAPIPTEVEDRDAADALIRQILYPDRPGRTLEQAVAAVGGRLGVVRDLGDAVLVVRGLDQSEGALASSLSRLEATPVPTIEAQARMRLTVARTHEARAAALLAAITFLAAPLERLAASYRLADLGTPPPAPPAYMREVWNLSAVTSRFGHHLGEALGAYVTAYNPPLGPSLAPRQRSRCLVKSVELGKLAALTVGPADTGWLKDVLSGFARYQDGRNPNLESWALHERSLCTDMATLREGDLLRARQTVFETYRRFAGPAMAQIVSGGGVLVR